MKPADVKKIRSRFSLSQTEFALLLGVHPQTVSQWERGIREPAPHKATLMRVFSRATVTDLHHVIAVQGEINALCVLLRAGLSKRSPRPE